MHQVSAEDYHFLSTLLMFLVVHQALVIQHQYEKAEKRQTVIVEYVEVVDEHAQLSSMTSALPPVVPRLPHHLANPAFDPLQWITSRSSIIDKKANHQRIMDVRPSMQPSH